MQERKKKNTLAFVGLLKTTNEQTYNNNAPNMCRMFMPKLDHRPVSMSILSHYIYIY